MRERCITETCRRNGSEEQVFFNQQLSRDFCLREESIHLGVQRGSARWLNSAASIGLCAMRVPVYGSPSGEWA
jgi:hypothetical protein